MFKLIAKTVLITFTAVVTLNVMHMTADCLKKFSKAAKSAATAAA